MGRRRVDADGLTRRERHQQLAAHGWTLAGRDRATGAWRFRDRAGRHLLVPSQSEGGAMRALLRQLQGETDVSPEPE
jgi:hypothetical protein